MPYLHWETDKKYREMAAITQEITKGPQKAKPRSSDKLWTQVSNDFRTFKTPLGRYLFYIADVYSRMDIAQDRALLESYLRKKSPLHGRRTLDQSYYWKLEDTGPRDEDQVVYRGTRTGTDPTRTTRVIMVDQLWLYILDDRMLTTLFTPGTKLADGLDTIITGFPRRWGRNKPDHSAGKLFRKQEVRSTPLDCFVLMA
jgi:hypothetical protein